MENGGEGKCAVRSSRLGLNNLSSLIYSFKLRVTSPPMCRDEGIFEGGKLFLHPSFVFFFLNHTFILPTRICLITLKGMHKPILKLQLSVTAQRCSLGCG